MPDLLEVKRIVNDERSVVRSSELLIDFVAAAIQSLIDRKAKLEDFQEFATALRNSRQALATAVARNTAAESSGEAEPVPAEQSPAPEIAPAPPDAAPIDEVPETTKKETRRATVKSAAKAVGVGYGLSRAASALKKRRSK